ncbi:PilZ domain protein [bacterium BMS3Abin14]|nr:PilZ domain protein [bacterium BMS3Abin14]
MLHKNRRKYPRVPTDVKVTCEHGADSFSRYTLNVSQGGIFIRTREPLEIGTTIKAEFTLPSIGHTFSIEGKVVWWKAQGNESGDAGMGIEFTDISKKDSGLLRQYVLESQITRQRY